MEHGEGEALGDPALVGLEGGVISVMIEPLATEAAAEPAEGLRAWGPERHAAEVPFTF